MKIVLAMDGSKCSKAALAFVRRNMTPAVSQVTVVSAVFPMVLAQPDVYVGSAAAAEELMEEERRAYQELASHAATELRDAGYPTEERVVAGDPRDVILKVAQDVGAELIVLGSHGRTGLAKLMMGSVATHVVTHARQSVLVVKADGTTA